MRKMADRTGRQPRGSTRRLSKQGGAPQGSKSTQGGHLNGVVTGRLGDWLHTRELSK